MISFCFLLILPQNDRSFIKDECYPISCVTLTGSLASLRQELFICGHLVNVIVEDILFVRFPVESSRKPKTLCTDHFQFPFPKFDFTSIFGSCFYHELLI